MTEPVEVPKNINISLTFKQAMIISAIIEPQMTLVWNTEATAEQKQMIHEAMVAYQEQVQSCINELQIERKAQQAMHDLLGDCGFDLISN